MPIQIPLRTHADFYLSDKRLNAMKDDAFQNVNLSKNSTEVNAARVAITEMGIWDTFVDRFFHSNAKSDALKLIAEQIICDQAEAWEKNYGVGSSCITDFAVRRREADDNLAELLTEQGRRVLLADPSIEKPGMVRFTARTDQSVYDKLLSISMPYDKADRILRNQGRFSDAAKIAHEMADISPIVEAANFYHREAGLLDKAGNHKDAIEVWRTCEKAYKRSAEIHKKNAEKNPAEADLVSGALALAGLASKNAAASEREQAKKISQNANAATIRV